MLEKQFQLVEENICNACKRANRNREDITLIAVTKTKPLDLLREAYALDARVFGENKVQELAEKFEVLSKDIRWHMIGHLQRNKIKYIIDKVSMIHSVDSVRLLQAIQKEAQKKSLIVPILVEVNVAREDSKFGLLPEDVFAFLKETKKCQNVSVKGLMTIAPYVTNPEENRPYFADLRKLSVDIAKENIDNVSMSVLSMGMTNDYEIAIEEGATMIRVGTGLFGARNYTQNEQNIR